MPESAQALPIAAYNTAKSHRSGCVLSALECSSWVGMGGNGW